MDKKIQTIPTVDNINYFELINLINKNTATYFKFPKWSLSKRSMVWQLRSQLKIHGANVIIGISQDKKYIVITKV